MARNLECAIDHRRAYAKPLRLDRQQFFRRQAKSRMELPQAVVLTLRVATVSTVHRK
jgi:hypothetical protein